LAASTYDWAHAPAKRQPTRSAERTDIWDANVTESFHEAYEFGFDIDTPTDIVQAHMRDQSGVIPKETFGHSLPESWKAWSQLSDDIQVDILRALQANGSQRSQESTHTPLLHNKPKYNWTRVPQNATLNRTVQFNTTGNDATTPSSITMSMHDTSTAGTPTPTNPDLDERVRDILSHIFGETHADGELDKLIASVTKQTASQHREWSQPKAQGGSLCEPVLSHSWFSSIEVVGMHGSVHMIFSSILVRSAVLGSSWLVMSLPPTPVMSLWLANSRDHSVRHPFLLHYYLHKSNTITLWMMIPI
jgi:hypothetical protein